MRLASRVDALESAFLRIPVALAVVCLTLSLVLPMAVFRNRDVDTLWLISSGFTLLGEDTNTSGGFQGENTLLGIGIVGTIVMLLVTVWFLFNAWGRRVTPGRARVGRWAATLLAIGASVLSLLVLPQPFLTPDEVTLGPAGLLLPIGAILSLLVVWGLRWLWEADRP